MSQWKNTDDAANSVLWAPDLVKVKANTTSQAAIFGNTTVDAFVPGEIVGQFGVSEAEMQATGGPIAETFVTAGGSGYTGNAVVTLTWANGTTNATSVNAFANVTSGVTGGSITSIKINQAGSGIVNNPTISVAAPDALNIVANTTGFSNTADVLYLVSANVKFQAGDRLYYSVPTSNTPIAPLTGNTYYYVTFANSTAIKIANTVGGANINLTDVRDDDPAAETHTVRGDTATGYVVVGGAKNKGIAHAGWVLRTEGTGGRAGRVQYETLVAMSSISTDASDDTILPDA